MSTGGKVSHICSCVRSKAPHCRKNVHLCWHDGGFFFKNRYNGHTSSFRNDRYKTATKLSEMVWDLKDQGQDYNITWGIIRRGQPYRVGQSSCDLCTSEKLEILKRSSDPNSLNSRTELISKCRHKRKFIL